MVGAGRTSMARGAKLKKIPLVQAFASYDGLTSAPAESGRDVGENRLDDMCIIGDAQLVRDGQE